METVSGATVVAPDRSGAVGEAELGPVVFGPGKNAWAYVARVGAMPAGDQEPLLHVRPHTDEGFYIAEGEMTVRLGDRGRPCQSNDGRHRSRSSAPR